jgi:hypothetical protein
VELEGMDWVALARIRIFLHYVRQVIWNVRIQHIIIIIIITLRINKYAEETDIL